jgi:hypothetical protein
MLKREKKEPRFVVQEKEGSEISSLGQAQVIVDKQTGVNYLWVKTGYAGGLTPLLDEEGKPIITK